MGKMTVRLELNSRKYVLVRFTRDGKYKKIATGVTSTVDQFNAERYGRWVSKADPDHERKNRTIESSLTQARKALDEARVLRNAEPQLEEVEKRTRQGESYTDVLGYYEVLISSFGNWNQQRSWKAARSKLVQYLEHEGRKSVDFREIDSVWLGRFDSWMLANNLSGGTRHTQIKRLRTAFNRGISDGLIPLEAYPFKRRGFKMPKATVTVKQRLSVEELRSISRAKLIHPAQADARDTFMVQYYLAGARIEDILRLKVQDVKADRVEFVMKKTQQGKSFPLSDALKTLISGRLAERNPQQYVFPWLDDLEESSETEIKMGVSRKTALVNKLLKKVAKKCGIDKPLTTHIARHSFSQVLVDQDVPIKIIQELLGHSSLAITERYINGLNRTKSDAVMNSLPVL